MTVFSQGGLAVNSQYIQAILKDGCSANLGLKCQLLYRNAGETKGVSPEVNKKNLEELKRLLALPHNRYCADCQGGGAASRASWASINNGTFICFRCAGVHRGLGVHISKVQHFS